MKGVGDWADEIRLRQHGAVSVEFVGALPFALLGALVAIQVVLAAGCLWSAAVAARAGARASHVGDPIERAVRAALPGPLRSDSDATRRDGAIVASVSVPRVLPVVPRFEVEAGSSLE